MSGNMPGKRFRRLLRVSLILSLVLGGGVLTAQERLKASYEAAQKLFQGGDDEQAEVAFRKLEAETDRLRSALLRNTTSQNDRDLLGIYTEALASTHNADNAMLAE